MTSNAYAVQDDLNPSQAAAAHHDGGHCLVLAGAGSGKTRTIIARIEHLLRSGVPARRILVITFTRRAAKEIVDRVERLIGQAADGIRAGTFHSFCLGLIRRYSKAFGVEGASIIDPDDAVSLMKLVRSGLNDKKLPKAADAIKVYTYARNVGLPLPQACIDQDLGERFEEIRAMVKGYEGRKEQSGYLDYDDLLFVVAHAMESDPSVRDLVVRSLDHVLVDELQDTNPLQWRLLDQLRDPAKLFCVGDDAQSIYKFRGADVKNVTDFPVRVRGATVLKLQDNYRSTQELLDLSNWLLSESPIPYNKRLCATRGGGVKPTLREFVTDVEEADWLANDLVFRHRTGGDWREHMILVRSSFAGRIIEQALLAKDVPYRFIGGVKLLESAHVKDVISVLRIVANHRDDLAWMRYLQLWPKIGEVTAERVAAGITDAASLQECLDRLATTAPRLASAVPPISAAVASASAPGKAFLAAVQALEPILQCRYADGWDMRKKDFPVVEKLAARHDSIRTFIEEYLLDPVSSSQVDKLDEDDAVTLITIHSSKGTECSVCYMPAFNPGQFPHARSLHSEDEIEEERRVAYVGMTRAQDELIISRTVRSYSLGSDEKAVEAYFLRDLPARLVSVVTPEVPVRSFRYRAW